jgi:hypothetical protein
LTGGRVYLRADFGGRACELGIVEGFVRSVFEPAVSDHNRIAGHDLASVGRAVADDPMEPACETDRSGRKIIAPANINDFIVTFPLCGQGSAR